METWKKIVRFNGHYEVSDLGRIRSVQAIVLRKNGSPYTRVSKILKPAKSIDGYLKGAVSINNIMIPYCVHRLVAEAFIPNPENKETVNHINGIKTDNRMVNLEWATKSENCQHSFDIGLQKPKRGSLNGMAKLTDEQVRMVRKMKADNGRFWGRNEIAKKLGIAPKHLQKIVNDPTSWIGV